MAFFIFPRQCSWALNRSAAALWLWLSLVQALWRRGVCVLCKVAGVAQGPESALSWWQWCLNELTPSEGEDLAVPAWENLWLHLRWYRNWSVLNTLSDTLKTFLTAYISHFIRIKTKQCQGYSGEHHTVTLPQYLQVNARGLSYSSSISHSPQLHGLLSASALHSIISESGLINSHFPRWKIKWLWKEFQSNNSVKQCKAKDTHQQFSSQSAVIFQSCQMQAQSCWNHSNLDQEGP